MLRGYKRQVQGSNGLNPAQPRRPLGSTQTIPPEHSRVQYPCSGGHAIIKALGLAHIPMVDSREDMIRLPSEKDPHKQKILNTKFADVKQEQLLQGWGQQCYQPLQGWDQQHYYEECAMIGPVQNKYHRVSPVRRQSGEVYSAGEIIHCKCDSWLSSLQGMDRFGVTANDRSVRRLLQQE